MRYVRWLRESSRDMITEGDADGAMWAAQIAMLTTKLFVKDPQPVPTAPPAVELDEIETTLTRVTLAGPVEGDDEP